MLKACGVPRYDRNVLFASDVVRTMTVPVREDKHVKFVCCKAICHAIEKVSLQMIASGSLSVHMLICPCEFRILAHKTQKIVLLIQQSTSLKTANCY